MGEGGSSFESRPADWLGVAEARDRILASARPLVTEAVPLEACDGRVLAESLVAPATLPPWDNSAMDGYAVRAADVAEATGADPVRLRVTGRVHAGDTDRPTVGAGQAVRIMTGAPLPAGADSIVRVEDTDAEAETGWVRVAVAVEEGRHVRPSGEDMRAGDPVLGAGRTVGPGVAALAAALGRTHLPLHARPRVALLATGDELRTPDRFEDVVRGRGIPESNTPMLAAMVRSAGGVSEHLGIGADDPADLTERIRRAESADVLVTIGGASMGEADLVKRVLDQLGFRQDFWRVRMRPGSPFSFGWLPRGERLQPVFGLPGNPSSAFVTFELFVRPFLLRLGGHARLLRPRISCVAEEDLTGPSGLSAYLRVRLDRDRTPPGASLTGPQGSGLVRGLALADGLAVLPEGIGTISAGDPVDVMLLEGAAEAESP